VRHDGQHRERGITANGRGSRVVVKAESAKPTSDDHTDARAGDLSIGNPALDVPVAGVSARPCHRSRCHASRRSGCARIIAVVSARRSHRRPGRREGARARTTPASCIVPGVSTGPADDRWPTTTYDRTVGANGTCAPTVRVEQCGQPTRRASRTGGASCEPVFRLTRRTHRIGRAVHSFFAILSGARVG